MSPQKSNRRIYTFSIEASFIAHVSAAAGFSCIALDIPKLQ